MKQNEYLVLKALGEQQKAAEEIARELNIDLGGVVSTLEKLASEQLAVVGKHEETVFAVTGEGRKYASQGTPERRLLLAVAAGGAKEGIELEDAIKKSGLSEEEKAIGLQWAVRKKWVAIEKREGKTFLKKLIDAKSVKAVEEEELKKILDKKTPDKQIFEELRQRNLAVAPTRKKISARVTPDGKKALSQDAQEVSLLTPQMLKSGEWKGKKFREYDLNTVAAPMQVARKHPYKEFLQRIKEKLVGLGFREVRGSLVELEFWNMDALFMPQGHPARAIHDVFHVKHPEKEKAAHAAQQTPKHFLGEIPDEKLFQEIFAAHRHGGKTGSTGWRYEMSREISSRVILRSHDTGISARELSKKLRPPDRVFFITRVFRPDEIDWKHFIEFNQLGGYVADENTSFRDLLGTLKTFAEEVFNAEKAKFVPSYFPFTEPSVGLYVKIPGRGWAEVGGAGLFRPELLSPFGIDYPVIAWGLGIDRLAMLSVGASDIRELHSHKLSFLQGK